MKNILFASACALLMSSDAFAQAASSAVRTAVQGSRAGQAATSAAPTAGRPASPRGETTAPRTGRTARTTETAAPRATVQMPAGSALTTATTAAGVSAAGTRQAGRVAAAPAAAAPIGQQCDARIQATRTLPFQNRLATAKKFGGATCNEVISVAGQNVAIKLVDAVEAAPASNDAAELTAAQRAIEQARPGISAREARAAAAGVMCNTGSGATAHSACVRALPSTGICQLAQREGLLAAQ